ncbi:hypothetical protein [Armatimonas sp.]|uniref:hypothetical protein n=1 Tax=Armatimonas sp. TaxID=1872638 RepID=UPI00286A0F06|nr:hypothetical protein [Armatimonas sp.]
MPLPDELAKEFATFPTELRKLVEAELKAGNTVVAIEYGFPAAPCGASLKLAQAVATKRRKSVGEVKFYARNNSRYAGEFTTELRHFFVLEPPLPPEPEPDMDAIRKALEPKPDALTPLAQTQITRAELLRGHAREPAHVPKRALTSTETATRAKRLLHFRDHRPPHEIQFALERDLMTLFAAALQNERLTMTAKAKVAGTPYDIELRFEAAMQLTNCYSLRVETSWANQAATNHEYYRKTADSWFRHWTRDFVAANPPAAGAGSLVRYQKICAASLYAEAHLDTVPALKQTLVAAMKQGASFATSHKEGGTNLRWTDGRFERSDYGDYPDHQRFSSDEAFLKFLRQFYDWETSQSTYPDKVSDFDAWKLILRLLRTS